MYCIEYIHIQVLPNQTTPALNMKGWDIIDLNSMGQV